MEKPNDSAFFAYEPGQEAADPAAAKKQAQGLTLVPYWGYNEQGRRVARCAWIKLKPGESLSDAAGRLTRAAQRQVTPQQ